MVSLGKPKLTVQSFIPAAELQEQVTGLAQTRVADLLAAGLDKQALKDSLDEVRRSADFLRFTAEEGKRLAGESFFGDAFPGFRRNKLGFNYRVPLGVVLAIPPFNYPVNLAISKIAPALVAGNTVLISWNDNSDPGLSSSRDQTWSAISFDGGQTFSQPRNHTQFTQPSTWATARRAWRAS